MNYNWIIAIGGSALDNVLVKRVFGTKEQIKTYLFKLIVERRDENNRGEEVADYGYFEYGTETAEQLTESENGKLYGYNAFTDAHEDFVAVPEVNPVYVLKL